MKFMFQEQENRDGGLDLSMLSHSLLSQCFFEGSEEGIGTGFPGRGVRDPRDPAQTARWMAKMANRRAGLSRKA